MNDKQPISDEVLEARLTAEAGEESPPFSQDLHERIMQRIATAPNISPRSSWRWPAIAAAAVLILGLSIFLKVVNRINPAPHPAVAIRVAPSVPRLQNPVQMFDQADWNNARYAYLDRDGEKVLGYMARQIDFLPARRAQ